MREGEGDGRPIREVGPDFAGGHVEQPGAVAVELVHAVAGVIRIPPLSVGVVSRPQGVGRRDEAERFQAGVLDLLLELEGELPAHEVDEHLKVVIFLGPGGQGTSVLSTNLK